MCALLLRLLYNGEGALVLTPYCCVLCCEGYCIMLKELLFLLLIVVCFVVKVTV